MSQLDARLGRRYSSVRSSDRRPAIPAPSVWNGSFNRRESDRLSSSRTRNGFAAAFKGEIRRVVLVEGDQYYREMLTGELLHQGFVVQAFADGASLLGPLATAVDADLVVLDWDLANSPGVKLLAELRRHGINLPVVFLTGKVIATEQHELLRARLPSRCPECLRMHGVRRRRRRFHFQVA